MKNLNIYICLFNFYLIHLTSSFCECLKLIIITKFKTKTSARSVRKVPELSFFGKSDRLQ